MKLSLLRYNAIPWRTRASGQAFNSVAIPRYVQIVFTFSLCHYCVVLLCCSIKFSMRVTLAEAKYNWSERDSFTSVTRNVETAVLEKDTSQFSLRSIHNFNCFVPTPQS